MTQEPETLYKLMSLYMLDKVNFPMTNSQLSKFFLEKEYTNYFTLQRVLNDLVESNLMTSRQVGNSTHYEITDDGRQALGFFVGDISEDAIADMNEYLETHKFSMRSEAGITAEYFKLGSDDYTVRCTARQGKSTIIAIDLAVSDEKAAEVMCANWKHCSQKLYSHIIHTLTNTHEDK